MSVKRLLKKSIQSKTLVPDCFGYSLTKTGFADKYLAGQITMYKSYSWLQRRFQKQLEQYDISDIQREQCDQDYLWICWLQGIENAPQLVQNCYDSIKYWASQKKIVVITKENYGKYVTFPPHIIEKWEQGMITNTHFSDLLRLELLIQYGGLWLDATTYLTGELPTYITESDFFVYRNGWIDMEMINMGSWLISSTRTNHPLLMATRDLLYTYWQKYNYMKNYFILHMFFRMVTDKYAQEWQGVPMVNHINAHMLMLELEKPYDEGRCRVVKELSTVHKLTYKLQEPLVADSTVLMLDTLYKN